MARASEMSLSQRILDVEERLSGSLDVLSFPDPVAVVYNPLVYAAEPHREYVRKSCEEGFESKTVVFCGMNPGPFGMVQTGVPFGEVESVRDWLGIRGTVSKPGVEHPKRPVLGFSCERREVSGKRFWGLVRTVSGDDPSKFFRHCFVHNYCPLAFLDSKGKNITPPSFNKSHLHHLQDICDKFMVEFLTVTRPRIVVAIGKYVRDRISAIQRGTEDEGVKALTLESILHPSPINPAANRTPGWEAIAMEQLEKIGVLYWMNSDNVIPETELNF